MGKLMKINLNWLQLNSGFRVPLLETDEPLIFLDNNWLLHSRTFLIQINAKMRVEDISVPKLERENDRTLMYVFCKLKYQKNLVQKMNYWRLFYQVNTVSDLCMADGQTVKHCYRTQPFQQDWHSSRKSELNWPRQQEPGQAGLCQWTKSLREGLGMKTGVIAKAYWLGKWTTNSENSESESDHYYDPLSPNCMLEQMLGI
jgi:hypothetical protein